jgi:PKD repeat protein
MVLALLLSAVAVVLPSQQVLAANEVWDIALNFTTNPANGSQAMTIGTVIGGSADPLVAGAPDNDSPAPPRPAASVAAAWLRTPGSNTAIIDRRDVLGPNAGNSVSWSVILSASDGTGTETTMTLAWPAISGVANFPLDATITLTGLGSAINMRSQTSVQVAKGNYTAVITVTRLGPPSTVWVDDDWSATSDGDIVGNGYIYGYNAFDTIQGGIDAVAEGGTVNVAAGAYTEDLSITKNGISVIGADGAAVTGGCTIDGTTGVTVENLSFTNTVYCYTTDDTTLTDLVVSGGTYGIYATQTPGSNTVYIESPEIYGVTTGIYVISDTAVVTNPWIYSVNSGIWADTNSNVTVTGGLIEIFNQNGIRADSSTVAVHNVEIANQSDTATGVFVGDWSTVEVTDCSRIHDNQYGFWVTMDGELVANFNSIYDNLTYGVYWAGGSYVPDCVENWWGDVLGPIVAGTSVSPRDGINRNDILYSPWLDAPCNQGGDPVGASAKFKAAPRTGEPGQKVQFTDQSTAAPGCTITEWLWKFGDGSSSTAQNPSHIYLHEGNFTVTLTVWDSCGFEQTVTMKYYITIKKPSGGAGGGAGSDTLEPARLGVSYLNIDPAQVLPNQEVTISANICNNGEERGSKTVSLMVNGEAVASQSVGVSGGSCQQVVFKTSRAVPGTYQVAIDGMTGEFSVLAPRTVTRNVPSQQQTGLGTAGIIAIIAVLIVLVAALIMVFKKD